MSDLTELGFDAVILAIFGILLAIFLSPVLLILWALFGRRRKHKNDKEVSVTT